jgi:hypothetical protein|tara:strand:+ start:1711 stop:2025 length:315 start_codon:yes stop_codon:yes gene_type:complete
MATTLAQDQDEFEPIQALPLGTTQTVSVASSSAANSTAFAAGTTVVRVVSTTDCHIIFATSPTATTSTAYLPANQVEYFKATAGEKIAAIRASADGTLYVTEMA